MAKATPTDPPTQRLELRVSPGTLITILVTVALVWALFELRLELFLLIVSLLLAVTFNPPVEYTEKRGWGRGVGVALVGLGMLIFIVGGAAFVLPPLAEEVRQFAENLPFLRHSVEQRLANSPFLSRVVNQVLTLPTSPEVITWMRQPLAWGKLAIGTVTAIILVLILTLYLLLDGKRLFAWLLAYVPRRYRKKMALMAPEVSQVVRGYVQGQLVTSLFAGVSSYIILRLFDVPAALPLAILAAVMDVIPVAGMIVAIVPAVLLALTVSPLAAGAVLGLYLLYHALETYVILPKVYGKSLQLSTLAVLLALILGASLGGIMGAILVLPLVAAYPIIERVWLHDYLSEDVLKDHTALERAAETGSDEVVDAVLKGEKHGTEPSRSR